MRIGIDARTLSGRYTGDRTYWRGLIGGLAALDAANEYVLYTRLPLDGDPPPGLGANVSWRQVAASQSDALWMLAGWPRALKADRIDVAHTQYNIPLLGAPCPVVTTVHDVSFRVHPDLFLPKDRWILSTLVPRSMRKAARVVAVSESTRRDILRFYPQVPKDNVRVILEAADARFRPPAGGQETARAVANKRLSVDDRPYLLAVGVLQPREDDTDAQMAALPEEVTRDIVLAGYVADDDLPTLYGGADALCYPSRYEGFGLPPLEAMACGCPVLCSRSSSLPEVVGDAGILLPPDDSDAWARALGKLLSAPPILARWRERGPGRAALFSWEKAARETLALYEECLEKK